MLEINSPSILSYPTVDALVGSMAHAGFTNLTSREIKKAFRVTDATPYREGAFSCLRLIRDAQFKAGLQRIENDLRKGPVQGTSEYICIWGKAPTMLQLAPRTGQVENECRRRAHT